jgi:lipopolysaccharide export LptBFGC system permease protein LptF
LVRTLHWYLGRDLLRIALLALVALTMIMTVFAIIEPLRKQGLGAAQVGELIAFTLPVMLTMTLPIAALFAATFVYGRFSQDNELMACRASGVTTFHLLKPALLLGMAVTVISLWLSNAVTPGLAQRAALAVEANIRGILYQKIRSQGHVRVGEVALHATAQDPARDTLQGVVVAVADDPENIRLLAAREARLTFRRGRRGQTYASVRLEEPSLTQTADPTVIRDSDPNIPREVRLPNPIKEDPAWYTWGMLQEVYQQPQRNQTIHERFEEIRQRIAGRSLAGQIVDSIRQTGRYDQLAGEDRRCLLEAPAAEVDGQRAVLTATADEQGRRIPVRCVVEEQGLRREILADRAVIRANFWPVLEYYRVSVELTGEVLSRVEGENGADDGGAGAAAVPAESRWVEKAVAQVGNLHMPREVLKRVESVPLERLMEEPQRYTSDPQIISQIRQLHGHDVRKLRGRILGQMHGRPAYSLSCVLLVSLGASLGMLFRGGQILSAFALSVIPAAVVVVMVLMGQQMLANPRVPLAAGMVSIWSGIVMLVVANAAVFWRMARR